MTETKKICPFCGGPAGGKHKSREDYWPKWLHHHPWVVQAAQGKALFAGGIETRIDRDQAIVGLRPQVRGRSTVHDVAKGFCKNCNNGWMSAIQEETSRKLGHAFTCGNATLGLPEMKRLSTWAIMTALVLEHHATSPSPSMLPISRMRFYEDRQVNLPMVLIGRTENPDDSTRSYVSSVGAHSNTTQKVFEFGAVVVFAIAHLTFIVSIGTVFPTQILKSLEAQGMVPITPQFFPIISIGDLTATPVDHLKICEDMIREAMTLAGLGLSKEIEATKAQ